MPRKVIVLSANWYPEEGGAERQLRQVLNGLARRDWSVRVVAGCSSGTKHAVQDADGYLTVKRVWSSAHAEIGRPPQGWELFAKAFFLALRPADVIVGSLVSGASLGAALAGWVTRTPVVLRIGGADFARLRASRLGRLQANIMLSSVELLVVNAPHLAAQVVGFRQAEGLPIRVIRNGVEPTRPLSRDAVDHSGPLRVIYYTNAGPMKNDPCFIRLVRACPEVSFRAIGRTDQLPRLSNLESLGWRDDVAHDLNWADVAVNTSYSEGSPNFLLQALSMGRPVLGLANEGVLDLHDQYPDAVTTVAMNDESALRDQLQAIDWRHLPVTVQTPTIEAAVEHWDATLKDVAAGGRRRTWLLSCARVKPKLRSVSGLNPLSRGGIPVFAPHRCSH